MNWTGFRKKLSSFGKNVSSRVKKYKTLTISGVAIATLFGILLLLPGGSITHSGDITCGDTCVSYINYTNSKYDIQLKNISELGINVYFDKIIREYQIYLKLRGEWVQNVDNLFIPKGTSVEFKLVGKKNTYETVKWGIKIGDTSIDPTWFGGKLSINKTYIEQDIGHFLLLFNLSSTVDYTIDDLDALKMVNHKIKGRYDVNYFEFRIKMPITYHNQTNSLSCPLPYFYNYTLNPKHLWCWENYTYSDDNITFLNGTRMLFEHDFDTYNLSKRTIYWNETKTTGGNYIKFNPLGETIQANKTYELGFYAKKNVELGETSIHFDLLFADNNLNMTWWNVTFNKCRKITNSTGMATNGFPAGYENVFTFNDTQIPFADFMEGFADIRITDGTDCLTDGGSEMRFWRHPVCNKSDTSANCTIYVNMTTANQTAFFMYYNAAGVSDVSNGWLTFRAFDDFDRANSAALGANWTAWDYLGANCNSMSIAGNKAYSNSTASDCFINWNLLNYTGSVTVEFESNVSLAVDASISAGAPLSVSPSASNRLYTGYSYVGDVVIQCHMTGGWNCTTTAFDNTANVTYNFRTDFVNQTQIRTSTYIDAYPNVSLTLRQSRIYPATGTMRLGMNAYVMKGTFDNFRMRLYLANPPQWTIGAEETAGVTAPDLNLSFGPAGTTSFMWLGCDPDAENATAQPENQTATVGINQICNNGTATGNVDINLSAALGNNWTIWASNTSISANLLNLTDGAAQRIYTGLTANSCAYIWFKANCSYANVGPGVYELYWLSAA